MQQGKCQKNTNKQLLVKALHFSLADILSWIIS